MAKEAENRPRLTITAILCIVVGLVIGFEIKKLHIGLMIGLALGLLSGNMIKRR
jgi:predicted ABC-type sugar transport system permease subunit